MAPTVDDVTRWEVTYGAARARADSLASELARLQADIEALQAAAAQDLAKVPLEDVRAVAAAKQRWETEAGGLRRAARELERRHEASQEQAWSYQQELLKARAAVAIAKHKTTLQTAIDALKRSVDAALSEPGASQTVAGDQLRAMLPTLLNAANAVDAL